MLTKAISLLPEFREYVWGGQRLRPGQKTAEAWIIYEGDVIESGPWAGLTLGEAAGRYPAELLGRVPLARTGQRFPLLIKLLDCADWLSVQVHPNDELAVKRGLGGGKSELWYILEAEKGAEIITGFNKETDRESFLRHLDQKRLEEILNREIVSPGDAFYMPAGRIHALGPGILLAEIQQTSDTTYRIYDWDRVDGNGKARELHTELALDAIDFGLHESYRSRYRSESNKPAALAHTPHFNTDIITLSQPVNRDYGILDSFVVHLCVEGSYRLETEESTEQVGKGEAVLIPATTTEARMVPSPGATVLEIYIL